eukprot:gene42282-52424_t
MEDFCYPRPQLVRADWTCLNGPWDFSYDDQRRYRGPQDEIGWERSINVPFPPESSASGIGDTGFHSVCWYRLKINLATRGPRTLLHFGAVDYAAKVWVNGELVAYHEGGHTPFYADITGALLEGEEQVIVLRAEDDPADLAKPRGKQDWRAGSA